MLEEVMLQRLIEWCDEPKNKRGPAVAAHIREKSFWRSSGMRRIGATVTRNGLPARPSPR